MTAATAGRCRARCSRTPRPRMTATRSCCTPSSPARCCPPSTSGMSAACRPAGWRGCAPRCARWRRGSVPPGCSPSTWPAPTGAERPRPSDSPACSRARRLPAAVRRGHAHAPEPLPARAHAPATPARVRRVKELLTRPALELAALIRAGELAARELTEAALARIEELEPQVGAFTHVAHEYALQTAEGIGADDPRPFAGVPIAIKDNRPVAGMPLPMCSDLFGDFVAGHDAHLVRRLKAAGFVIVGKTKLPEMGILPTTEPRRFGPARNPWAADRTPGGSSGGSAVAVAAGMVPIAHGNDGGGSIRIPAACCGLVGLKPARGRVSAGPDAGHSFLAVDGVLARTVGDCAAALDVLAGYEPGDASWAPPPAAPFRELAQSPAGSLRIALVLEGAFEDAVLDGMCERAALDAAGLLERLGHRVAPLRAPWVRPGLLADFTRAFGPLVSLATLQGQRLRGRDLEPADVEPLTYEMFERARSQDALEMACAQVTLERTAREIVRALSPYDAVLTPALAQRPVPIGEIHGRGPDTLGHFRRSGAFTPYT